MARAGWPGSGRCDASRARYLPRGAGCGGNVVRWSWGGAVLARAVVRGAVAWVAAVSSYAQYGYTDYGYTDYGCTDYYGSTHYGYLSRVVAVVSDIQRVAGRAIIMTVILPCL